MSASEKSSVVKTMFTLVSKYVYALLYCWDRGQEVTVRCAGVPPAVCCIELPVSWSVVNSALTI